MNNPEDLNYLVSLMLDTISYSSTKASIMAIEEQKIQLTKEQKEKIYQDVQNANKQFVKNWIEENPKEKFQS